MLLRSAINSLIPSLQLGSIMHAKIAKFGIKSYWVRTSRAMHKLFSKHITDWNKC